MRCHTPLPLALALLLLLTTALSTEVSAARARSSPIPAEDSCELCHDAVSLLTTTLADTAAVVEAVQRRVCTQAAPHDQQCRLSVGSVLPPLLTIFKSPAASSRLCSAPTACGAGPSALSGYDLLGMTAHRVGGNNLLEGGVACSLCTFLVNRLKLMLNDSSVQESILEMADTACSTLPAEFSGSCVGFVQTYEPMLTRWVLAIDSTGMCFLAGVCFMGQEGSKTEAAVARQQLLHLPLSLSAPLAGLHRTLSRSAGANDAMCDVCQLAVTEAHALVANPDTQGALLNYTKSLCAYAGGPFTKDCLDLVDTYAPDLFDYLADLLSPGEVCTELGACHASLLQRWRQHVQILSSRLQGSTTQGDRPQPQQEGAGQQQQQQVQIS